MSTSKITTSNRKWICSIFIPWMHQICAWIHSMWHHIDWKRATFLEHTCKKLWIKWALQWQS